jgi:hypothetical protein
MPRAKVGAATNLSAAGPSLRRPAVAGVSGVQPNTLVVERSTEKPPPRITPAIVYANVLVPGTGVRRTSGEPEFPPTAAQSVRM